LFVEFGGGLLLIIGVLIIEKYLNENCRNNDNYKGEI